MDEPRNIQIFQEIAARTLNRLYLEFPNPIDFDLNVVGQEVAVILDSTEDEQFRILAVDAINVMKFMVKEGFIDFRSERRYLGQPAGIFPQSIITLKGLTLLGAIPPAVNELLDRRPLADQLSDALNDGARSTVGEIVKSLFFGALAAGTSVVVG